MEFSIGISIEMSIEISIENSIETVIEFSIGMSIEISNRIFYSQQMIYGVDPCSSPCSNSAGAQ